MENIEFLFLNTAAGPLFYYADDDVEVGDYILFESMDEIEDFTERAIANGVVAEDFFEHALPLPFTMDLLERGEGTLPARRIHFENGEIWRD